MCPLFVYHCPACNTETEKLEKYTEESVYICPKCEERLIKVDCYSPSFRIDGFSYKNGYSGWL